MCDDSLNLQLCESIHEPFVLNKETKESEKISTQDRFSAFDQFNVIWLVSILTLYGDELMILPILP